MANIDLTQIPSFYQNYVRLVPEGSLKELFEKHQTNMISYLKEVPEDKWNYRYAEGKWTIKEMVQHIIDAERIFTYRALRFARKDSTPLPGFEENEYAAASKADKRTINDLIEELSAVQKSTSFLYDSFDDEQLDQTGTANNNKISVRNLGYILIGHTLHHKKILQERYLGDFRF